MWRKRKEGTGGENLVASMKVFLLSVVVLTTCMVTTESSPFASPLRELDEQRKKRSDFILELIENVHLRNLTCAECMGDTERDCTFSEVEVQCAPGEICTTLEAFSLATLTTTVTRQCFNLTEPNCDLNPGCSALNSTGDIQSCLQFCCNVSLCNAGILTTDAPTTIGVTTDGGPSTGASNTPITATTPLIENVHLRNLTCAECMGDTERECTLSEVEVQCAPGEICTTLEAFSLATFTSTVTRQCFNLTEPNCDFNPGCSALLSTGDIQSCVQVCCNVSLCNAGILTTDAPTTIGVTTDGGPSTGASTTPITATTPLIENVHLRNLTCAECMGDTERECTLSEVEVQCAPGEICTTLEAFSLTTLTTTVTRQCFNLTEPNCDFNPGCSALKSTGDIQSCDQFCCNVSLCNAGILTTDAPTTSGVTTAGPTTEWPTETLITDVPTAIGVTTGGPSTGSLTMPITATTPLNIAAINP
ncbi:threonine-rich protein-like isoform X2 [Montipora foliosa]|uniref:threonine-rich protein-like isoform X2 n=1 Tax=Montipora foliosa TaxID=591990 RepID=UPI0035F1F1F1